MNKKIACLFLTLCLVFCLAACSEAELTDTDFAGTWSALVDITDEIAASFSPEELSEALGGIDASAYISFDDFKIPPVTVVMQLNPDGSFSMVMDESSKEIISDSVISWFSNADIEGLFTEILTDQCKQYGTTMEEMMSALNTESVSELIETMLGMPLDEYMDALGVELSGSLGEEFDLSQFTSNGSWKYDLGKVVLTTDEGEQDELSFDKAADTLTEPDNGETSGKIVFSRD